VFNAYIYYVALPAFIFLELSYLPLTSETLKVIAVVTLPIVLVLALYWLFTKFLKFERRFFIILSLSTVFGSTAFFGIPYVTFSYPQKESLQLAALVASISGIVGLTTVITLLELYSAPGLKMKALIKLMINRFKRNPLIISIVLGFLSNVMNLKVSGGIYKGLDMIGKSTAVIAIFMLGLFLYGREYRKIWQGFIFSLPRALLLPLVTYVFARLFGLTSTSLAITVLLSGMPVALTMITITQKYEFEVDLFANLILVSTLSSLVYLNLLRSFVIK
ncbi:MAG: AEC family transporter, partial [bacterium]|nr:AEC family transporter [bacterium]